MANSRLCSIEDCGKPSKWAGLCQAHYSRLRRHGDPLGGRTPVGEPLRFINEVVLVHKGAECLAWPYGKSDDGAGRVTVDGRKWIVSRYVCERTHGAPPTPEHEAAHNCGKGHESCVNPNHLEWKTHVENEADKLIHGTHSRGERSGNAKLTEEQAREIISLKGAMTLREIGIKYGVSEASVSLIQNGINWSWLLTETR